MSKSLSPNTQAILLLTAPLIAGRNTASADILTQSDYTKLARFLISLKSQPSDLLGSSADQLICECDKVVRSERLRQLLDRGFLLGQAVERWQSRAIWVVSRADSNYPQRLKDRLKDAAPTILYGSGDAALLSHGGLAVVGSRHVDDSIAAFAGNVGVKAAQANRTIISGGARGVDLAAMRGALETDGNVVGMLSERLESVSLNRQYRQYLMDGRLVFSSPYDPLANFHVGHAMNRNKLIYALSDVALIVNAEYRKGGTWAGAIEQLETFHLVPIFVRSAEKENKAFTALRKLGAKCWPNPETRVDFETLFSTSVNGEEYFSSQQAQLFANEAGFATTNDADASKEVVFENAGSLLDNTHPAAEQLFAKVKELVLQIEKPISESEFADYLGISKSQAKEWLNRMVQENVLRKTKKPVKYSRHIQTSLLN